MTSHPYFTFTTPAVALAITCGALASLSMNAQTDRSLPPAPGPPPEVHVGEHSTFTLSNGLRVIVVENTKLPLVGVQFHADMAPVLLEDRAGLPDLVGETLASGTEKRDKAAIDDAIDAMGATFQTSSEGVYAACLKEHVSGLLALVREVVISPTFPEDEFKQAQQRLASAVKQRDSDPEAIAETVTRAAIFGKAHPYGEVVTDAALGRLEAADARAWHARFYRPETGYLVFVGDITEKEARTLAKEHFGKWKATPLSKGGGDKTQAEEVPGLGKVRPMGRTRTPGESRKIFVVDRPGASQSVIRVGYPVNLKPNDLRVLDTRVMNTIMGGAAFNTRLQQNLREDKGWTYGIYSSLDPDRHNAHFVVSVSVRTEVTDSAVAEILNELGRMRSEMVSAEEVELARSTIAGGFGRSLEDPRTVARFALNLQLNGLPPDHYETYLQRLAAVGRSEVHGAAEAFLRPDGAYVLVVGDLEVVRDGLERIAAEVRDPIVQIDVHGEPVKEVLSRAPDVTPDSVIAAYLEAIGGRSKAERIDDLHIAWNGSMDGRPIQVREWFATRGRYRWQLIADGQLIEELIHDGERAVRRSVGEVEELFDIDLRDPGLTAAPVPELDMVRVAERMNVSGRTTLLGRQVYKLQVKTRAGTTWSDYFDVASGMRLRRVDQKFMHGRGLTITTDLLDHRPVMGVLFPHRIEQRGGVHGRTSLIAERIEANKGFPEGFFDTGLPLPED